MAGDALHDKPDCLGDCDAFGKPVPLSHTLDFSLCGRNELASSDELDNFLTRQGVQRLPIIVGVESPHDDKKPVDGRPFCMPVNPT